MVSSMDQKTPFALALIMLLLGSVCVVLFTPLIGFKVLAFENIFFASKESIDAQIFWNIRVPRTLVAFLAGGTFALCGMVFQALFRNPLVSPATLGVSSGAAFGAAVYIALGLSFNILGITGISLFAFSGAMLSIAIVWSLSKIKYGSSISKMLLAGIAVSFFFVSLIMFIQYLGDVSQSFRISRWLMGGIFVFGFKPLWDILPFTVVGLSVIMLTTNELNLFTTGEDIAVSRGVNVDFMIKFLFVVISLVIAGTVSICGPISFVGIIAPHICRLLIGFDHRQLTPCTFLFGGLFLTICDTFARIIVAPGEIPVGIITALLGGPFFLWLLHKRFT